MDARTRPPLQLLLAATLAATGCWPGLPIAAGLAGNQSDHHHQRPATVTIQGTIVTDATVLPPTPPNLMQQSVGGGPVLDLSATEVDFGLTGTNLVVQARNAGDGDLVVSPTFVVTPVVGADANWLKVALLPDGKTIQLTANRIGEVDGPYQAQVDVTSNGGSGSFLVDATVKAGALQTPIGPVIVTVSVVDEGTLVVTEVARVTTTAADGYAWSIPFLPRGRYLVEAGVDLDSDGVIGEPGEPFGAYPSATAPMDAQVLEADLLSAIAVDLLVHS
jgi:hypothetical protein